MFFQRIDNLLVQHGYCSKRSCKTFLKNNVVILNETRIFDIKQNVNESDDNIFINGKCLPKIEHIYLMMNKPAGYVCSSVSDRSCVVYELLEKYKELPLFEKIHSVGRLDKDTEGLILFTSNGNFSNFVTSEKNEITKTYYVELCNSVSTENQNKYIEEIEKGIFIPAEKKAEGFYSKPGILKWISEKSCELTISEGKFHQVRRTFSALGNEVVYLKRIAIGKLKLDESLKLGESCYLSKDDINLLCES